MPFLLIIFCLFLALPLNACTSIAYNTYQDHRLSDTLATDTLIANTLKAKLLADGLTKNWGVSVYCYYGNVWLVGEIPTDVQENAINMAKKDNRVLSVKTLWFDPRESEQYDIVLATKVRAELISNLSIKSTRIDTVVNSGRVAVLGVVANETEKTAVLNAISGVSGVIQALDCMIYPPSVNRNLNPSAQKTDRQPISTAPAGAPIGTQHENPWGEEAPKQEEFDSQVNAPIAEDLPTAPITWSNDNQSQSKITPTTSTNNASQSTNSAPNTTATTNSTASPSSTSSPENNNLDSNFNSKQDNNTGDNELPSPEAMN